MSSFQNENNYKSSDFLQTLERGIMVIQSFKDHSSLTITESSEITGLSKPVTRRVLITLEILGYVKSSNKRFSLTPKILSIGYSYISSKNIWDISKSYLEEISSSINESCSLAVLDDLDIVYVSRVAVNNILSFSLGIGTKLPAHATSSGRVLLAHLSSDELDSYFKRQILIKYTNKTTISEKEIRKELLRIRQDGYAICQDELELGLLSIAVPVHDVTGSVVAAIHCATHSGRSNIIKMKEKILPLLMTGANKIGNELHFKV